MPEGNNGDPAVEAARAEEAAKVAEAAKAEDAAKAAVRKDRPGTGTGTLSASIARRIHFGACLYRGLSGPVLAECSESRCDRSVADRGAVRLHGRNFQLTHPPIWLQ